MTTIMTTIGRLVGLYSSLLLVLLLSATNIGGSRLGERTHYFLSTPQSSDNDKNDKKFITLEETMEMAQLSSIVYEFRDQSEDFCLKYNVNNVKCAWYYHETSRYGTQVLIAINHKRGYVSVTFAGTDDFLTSLTDVDILQKKFGNGKAITIPSPNARVHAGFNNALFEQGLYDKIEAQVRSIQRNHPNYNLYTTGHSLGGANSVFMSIAWNIQHPNPDHKIMKSITFGCPQTGNQEFHNYINSSANHSNSIWRLVLAWDLVPRLPDFFHHVGHTVQLWNDDHKIYDKTAMSDQIVEAYYHHTGNATLGYASVPPGWSSKPHMWIPGALLSHSIVKYIAHLLHVQEQQEQKGDVWATSFMEVNNNRSSDDDITWDDDSVLPDDIYPMEYFEDESVANKNDLSNLLMEYITTKFG